MSLSKIEWTDRTWNPVIGCTRVSAGCENCYAERQVHRGMQPAHRGLTVEGKHGPRWNGEVRFIPERLEQPLHWKRPQRIFVNSLSDLFHEALSTEEIARVFLAMNHADWHTYQVLTKRPQRMRDFMRTCESKARVSGSWPPPNIWLGVSVEDQATADERIPLLLETPAANRFVSYEPALAAVDFSGMLKDHEWEHGVPGGLDWVICGGESGPGARPFDIAWARSTVEQCKDAGVKVFCKQLGSNAVSCSGISGVSRRIDLRDRKGADPTEWPDDLRVREFPDAHL